MTPITVAKVLRRARGTGTVVPAFNIPYLPMMEPVVRALRDAECFGLIAVARLEWEKFEAGGVREVRDEYERLKDESFTRLHLDHVPVIDEDGRRVDYESILGEAVRLGYDSVMVDGSRLSLEENIRSTRLIVETAHAAGVPVEGELGAVMGHEAGPLPPYERLFASRRGFTDPDQARRFVDETGVDWLSVAVGSVHGAISAARKHESKIAARLDIEHLDRIGRAVGIPLVLHGGTGIPRRYIMEAVRHGIAKINIATAIRQPYEAARPGKGTRRPGFQVAGISSEAVVESVQRGQEAVYRAVLRIVRDELEIEGSAAVIASRGEEAEKA